MKRKFAVFDIDGTFFRSHLFWEVVLELANREILHPKLNEYTVEMYDKWKRRTSKRAFEDFDYGVVGELKSLVTELDPIIYDEVVKNVIESKIDHVYTFSKQLMKELKEKDYFVIAISGSRQEEVDIFAPYHGFDDWIGQKFERSADGKKYTGNIEATFKDKHITLDKFVKKHNLTYKDSYAIGDTGSDISMLDVVENPVAFNPNHSLLEHAQQNGWKIVIERKSIVYTMEAQGGSYLLAKTDV
jgi:HAD superfamily hydrolase (TIGR01490 family)